MLQHLIQINDLTPEDISQLLKQARQWVENKVHLSKLANQPLAGKSMVTLFFECSTRTRISFELAAKRLGCDVVQFNASTSSTQKGETLIDTFLTLQAMGCDFFVMRHNEDGAPNTLVPYAKPGVSIINAGDGMQSHPTQALLDLLTISLSYSNLQDLKIAIVGDILHSRVARSELELFEKVGIQDIRLIGPKHFVLSNTRYPVFHDLAAGIEDVDVIILLRIQLERLKESTDLNDYAKHFCLTNHVLTKAKKNVIVMHPGPINRGIEISPEVADGSRAMILKQVENGVAMRMAILNYLSNL